MRKVLAGNAKVGGGFGIALGEGIWAKMKGRRD